MNTISFFKHKYLQQSLLTSITKVQTATKCSLSVKSDSVDQNEIGRFDNLASTWWNRNGPTKALHSLNSIRVPFIRDGLTSTGIANKDLRSTSKSLSEVKILEIGCGAGILTEQLARIHANVTGIDPSKAVIDIAIEHSAIDEELKKRISYYNQTIEEHCNIETNKHKYDAVVVSEVLEHVLNKADFLKSCLLTLKLGGSIFITTFDKTCLSYVGAIVLAENIMGLVPVGTHNWDNFITPLDTQRILDENGCNTILINGFVYETLRNKWHWIPLTNLSYALQAVKIR